MSGYEMNIVPGNRQPKVASPVDMVDLRTWLIRQWSPQHAFYDAAHVGILGGGGNMENYCSSEVKNLKGSLWYVTEEMCELLEHAAGSMPMDTEYNEALTATDMLRHGFAYFERMIIGQDAHTGQAISMQAMSWGPGDFLLDYETGESMPCVSIMFYGGLEPGETMPLGSSDWLEGTRLDDDQIAVIAQRDGRMPADWLTTFMASAIEDRKILSSFIALAGQSNLADVRESALPRQVRRRAERDGFTDVRPVRVVHLRRPQGSKPESEGEQVNWSHRWVVEGHWRQQAWGPNRSLRRPTYIAPFVKGPADRPLVLKETVRVIDR